MSSPSPARSWSVHALGLALAALFVFSPAGDVQAGSWKGTETTENGVVYVNNPAQAMEDPMTTVELEELWRLGGDTDNEDEFFGVINKIIADDEGSIYVLDSQLSEIKVFSSDGEPLRTIGREGEGPGEFRRPSDMFFLPDGNIGVLQVAPGRIVLLSPDGEPAGEHPLPPQEDDGAIFLLNGSATSDHMVLSYMKNKFAEGKFEQERIVACIDSDGTEVGRLHSEVRELVFANAVFEEKQWDTFDRRLATAQDGRVFACTDHSDYEIHVWKPGGKLDRVIARDYERLERTKEEVERTHGIWEAFTRQVPNATVKLGDHFKDINTIFSREDGSLWVMNSRGSWRNPEGSLGLFDVYDRKGHFVRQVTLNGQGDTLNDGYFFVKDRLYVVTDLLQALMAQQGGGNEATLDEEEEPEPMSIICYQIDVPDMGDASE